MFTHLHTHTEYSLLDGMCRIPLLVARAKEMGMDAIAVTDHGVMYGTVEFYRAAKTAGIKPIIGCEVYVARGSRTDRSTADKNAHHLVLLAKDKTGYHNLMQLITRANLEGFYYKPRVDKELLRELHAGLIALTACLGGEIPQLLLENRYNEAREAALWYKETFGDDFYLEIQRHPMPELEKVNGALLEMHRELGIPIIATSDAHYIRREDAVTHDMLLCIGTNTTVDNPNRMKMAGDYFYLTSPEEMAETFRDIPEALENTARVAAQCNVELDFGRLHLPEIALPPGQSAMDYLRDLCTAGLPAHYPDAGAEIRQRLDYELDVIEKTQFANYFLVVWDIISFVRQNNILFGVRGSAAASIVLHCLGITEIDPLAHKLVFERFLNIERKEMPDIDMDFEDTRREEVIGYVTRKYGQDHVAQIITFGTLGARAALRDIGRCLALPLTDVDRVARLIPGLPGMTLDRAMAENAELAALYRDDEAIRKLIDRAKKVEGIARHASTHAAGVVISKEPLSGHVPLQLVSKEAAQGTVMTQYNMDDIAKIGLLKMDFLGLINLTILARTRDFIRQNRGVAIDLYHLPMNDQKTFDLLSAGETAGVFQLEGAGMRRYIRELKPTTFSDIAAMVALYRPGPMEHIPTFISAKHGETAIHYPHPDLKDILEETYGVIVYQDQVLFIVRRFAGYSLGQADIFRKAMGKKIPEVMQKEKANFINGAVKNGYSRDIAEAIFKLIEPFAGYAFNKAHSVSYAMIAYQTAYLKANYPAEYITAMLVSTDQLDKIATAVAEGRRLGLSVLPPDINRSQANFSIEKDDQGRDGIRFGLAAIKHVGPDAVAPLVNEREQNGPFKSVEDLTRRVDLKGLNRRAMESLIKTGAFDSLAGRGTLLANLGRLISLAQREQKMRDTGQTTMFDIFGEEARLPAPSLDMEPAPDISVKEKLAWEKELSGVYLSQHPFSAFKHEPTDNVVLLGQIDTEMAGQNVLIAGLVTSLRPLLTRNGEAFASAVMEDLEGKIEVIVWPKVYAVTRELWKEGEILLVEGRVKMKDDELQVACNNVRPYQKEESAPTAPAVNESRPAYQTPPQNNHKPAPPPAPEIYHLIVSLRQTEDKDADSLRLRQVMEILKSAPGEDKVSLRVIQESSSTLMRLPFTVQSSTEIQGKLAALVGADNLRREKNGNGH